VNSPTPQLPLPPSTKTMVAFATLAGFAILASAILLLRFWYLSVQDDVVGTQTGPHNACNLRDSMPVLNRASGYVAVVRIADCPGPLTQGTTYYVTFVHAANVESSAANLVFQYEPAQHGYSYLLSPPPRLFWRNRSLLEVKASGIWIIKKQIPDIYGITILYTSS